MNEGVSGGAGRAGTGGGASSLAVALSSVVADPAFGIVRHPPDPAEDQHIDYIERLDVLTIFYDIFLTVEGDRIIALGPPLDQPIRDDLRVFSWPDGAACAHSVRRLGGGLHIGYEVTTILPPDPSACQSLLIEVAGQRFLVPVQPSAAPFLAGARVLIAKNYNNDLIWIRDWTEFHVREYGFDAVLIYDNDSDRYTPGDIERALARTPGIARVAVVAMPFSFGPVLDAAGRRVARANHLQYAIVYHAMRRMAPLADLMFHADIDELVIAEQPDEFRALLADERLPQVIVHGVNIANAAADPAAPSRHREFWRFRHVRDQRPNKWFARPRLVPETAFPSIHHIIHCPEVHCPREVALVCNLLGITTGWKVPGRLVQETASKHPEFPALREALGRIPWAEPNAADPDDPLDSGDAWVVMRWAIARLRAGDHAAAGQGAARALALQPDLFAAREVLDDVARVAPDPEPMPRMSLLSHVETDLFDAAVREARCVIEYGMGGSTRRLAALGIPRVISIESATAWVDTVSEHPAVATAVEDGRVVLVHVDIGPTAALGSPADTSRRDHWPDYWLEPWRYVRPEEVDLVFVDGRFRVACALQALLAGRDGMKVLFHDFWNRPFYHTVLSHVTCIGQADTAGLFVRSPDFDREAAERDLIRFARTAL
ncbi:MAG: hypothetical protein ACR2J8_13510 [Thermomicrobiales bacterium]